MKKIEAIIKPFLLDEVYDALVKRRFVAMTVSEIRNFQTLPTRNTIGPERTIPLDVDFSSRLKIELVVNDENVEAAIEIVQKSAQLSESGIVVQNVDDVIRIRTNEHGAVAV
ncbi:MAG: nitrogen regulatory protein P-II 1 [Verrucomicrobiales bacterium]|jgi:nitrogen regulatory protein P-II 1